MSNTSREPSTSANAATPNRAAGWQFDDRELSIYTMEEGSPVFLFQPHELCDGDLIPWGEMVALTRVATAAPDLLAALSVVTDFAAAAIEKLGLRDTNNIIGAAQAAIAKATGQ